MIVGTCWDDDRYNILQYVVCGFQHLVDVRCSTFFLDDSWNIQIVNSQL